MNEHAYTETLTHQKGPAWGVASSNEYGEPAGVTATIKARVEPSSRRILMTEGNEHQSSFEVFTAAEVRVGDFLTIQGAQHMVAASTSITALNGSVDHWEVVC